MIRRRQFLSLAALSTLAPYARSDAGPSAQQASFARARATHPWMNGYRSAHDSHFSASAGIQGNWPEALTGTLYRNGPAIHDIGNFRYGHWFDGDGMMNAYRVREGQLQHVARVIETNKVAAERAAGRALYPAFDSVPPNPAPVPSADTINPGNISVLPHHGKLLALWEAGSAWDIDPETLETNGLYHFDDDTAGAPFSAHPRVEPDGTLWNFGYMGDRLVLWHIASTGDVVKVGVLPVDSVSMVHDFLVTQRHIVVMIGPLHAGPVDESQSFLARHTWAPEDATKVLVIDKNDFTLRRTLELPAQWVFHYGNAWEDEAGVIRFDGARADDPSVMFTTFRAVMRGEWADSSPSKHHRYRIDTKRWTIQEAPMFSESTTTEFPAIDPRVSTQRNNRLICLARKGNSAASHPLLDSVAFYDDGQDQLSTFTYPGHVIPEEHLYVADESKAPEQGGWIIGTAYNYRDDRTELSVFNAEDLASGPVAQAQLPYAIPLGLHGKYLA